MDLSESLQYKQPAEQYLGTIEFAKQAQLTGMSVAVAAGLDATPCRCNT